MFSCPSCGRQLVSVRKFCRYCGHAIPAVPSTVSLSSVCPRCGTRNDAESNFCKNCGAPLKLGSPEPDAPGPAVAQAPESVRGEVATGERPAPEFTGTLPSPVSPAKPQPRTRWPVVAIVAVAGIGLFVFLVWPRLLQWRAEYWASPISVQASSALEPQGVNSYVPQNTLDRRLDTGWVEGVPGPGIGEWISFSFAPQKITSIEVYPGYGKSKASFYRNNRVKAATIIFSNATTVQARFEMQCVIRPYSSPHRSAQIPSCSS